eukprot:3284823-Prymnesium_polylepis.1
MSIARVLVLRGGADLQKTCVCVVTLMSRASRLWATGARCAPESDSDRQWSEDSELRARCV